jgi:type II secretory pathway predicted ATPase ExeA
MKKMTEKAQKIWNAFCVELAQEPTDDMREALATAIREVANELQYYQCCEEEGVVDMVVDARDLYDLADELETLK